MVGEPLRRYALLHFVKYKNDTYNKNLSVLLHFYINM